MDINAKISQMLYNRGEISYEEYLNNLNVPELTPWVKRDVKKLK